MTSEQPPDLVFYYRSATAQTVTHNTDATAVISQLLCVDKPLADKFVHLRFCDILAQNAQSVDSLKRLILGLNILEKYGRHLLKSPEIRSNMWRHIKFTNSIFRDRVDTIQGGREIMAQMGYSVIKDDGVAFPDGADPDPDRVLQLVVDILLAKKEIEAYLSNVHPHPHYIEAYLHPDLLAKLGRPSASPATQRLEPQTTAPGPDTTTASSSSDPQTQYTTASEGKESSDTESETHSRSITCDICGKNHPDFVCTLCDDKRLCRDCDQTWHKHPKRQNHPRVPLGSIPVDQMSPTMPQGGSSPANTAMQRNEGGGQRMPPREPMSLYPSEKNTPSFVDRGYSLPPTAFTANTLAKFEFDQQMMLGNRPQSAPQFAPQTSQGMVGLNQAWTGSSASTTGSQPTLTGSPYHMPGAQQSNAMPSTTSSYQRGVGVSQGSSQVNIVNPLPYSQQNIHYQQSPGMRPAQSYGVGYSMAPSMATPMSQYPGNFSQNSMQLFASHDQPRFNFYTPPQTLDRFSVPPYIPPGLNRGMENTGMYSPKTPEIPQTPSTGSSSASMSHLLPTIVAIPDLEKRMSRIRVDLMNLHEDIKEWDVRINAIILENPNFFQDDDYKSLNRKKRRHLQEIKELENYSKELQKALDVSDKNAREKEINKSEEDKEIERLRQRLGEIKGGDQFGQDVPQQQYPQYMYHGMMPQVPGSDLYNGPYTMPRVSAPGNQVPMSSQSIFRPARPDSTSHGNADDLPEDIKRMLVLDQNPFEFRTSWDKPKETQPVMNIPVTPQPDLSRLSLAVTGARDLAEVSYPPNLLQHADDVVRPKSRPANTGSSSARNSSHTPVIKHGASEPNLAAANHSHPGSDLRKNQSAVDMTVWECEHCTYQNDITEKACAICYKTSENPKVIGPSGVLIGGLVPDVTSEGEPCEHCTYRNPPGTKICEMCARTQTKYMNEEVLMTETEVPDEGETGGVIEAQKEDWEEVVSGSPRGDVTSEHAAVGRLIDEEQDKVYLEKKAAQATFDKSQSQDEDATRTPEKPRTVMASPAVRPGPMLPAALSPQAPNNRSENATPIAGHFMAYPLLITPEDYDLYPLVQKEYLERVRRKSEQDPASGSTSGSYGSAQTSLENLAGNQSSPETRPEPLGASKEPQGAIKKGRPQVGFAEAIEQISIKREQEQMSVDGHDFVQVIKEAENAGFEIAEIHIAQHRCVQDKMKPLDWLKQRWTLMLEAVTTLAAEIGKQAERNDIGDLSVEEAKEALLKCEGEVEKAAKICADARAVKYQEISGEGPSFAREDILTALYQNRGSTEEALDQLNQAIVQVYLDRVWTEGEESRAADRELALEAASRSSEGNTSISNSIIGHDAFQRIIKNVQISRERRVRMVFVEGKLTSWGRADTVITILDNEVTNAEEPLLCSLEDIIEAVRNCGDRKSSLYYLKQECGCCFALYPMSKINNLTACNCKICHDCVKQNFEVVIREQYVRNWNCPLCSLPDFEDETLASEYFEFLTLILQARVSQEVLDLFETKLRDWHLQKDPNFRWCAHCASGFIWDRPQVLGMACPHCQQKTCFQCKKKWEEQHEGLTCEQFTQWGIDNDPEKQAKGVQVYLEQNGIDCPSCKMRYDLAKGGCMHFKCPQCGHEFCSGCYQPFLKDGVCKMYRSCHKKGLHCHHPRDCFYWLRDYSAADLMKLLKNHKVVFNTEVPETQVDKKHCPLMEQKEYGVQKKDEPCNEETKQGMAGLCEKHFKEYLVGLINKGRIDPLGVMSLQDMRTLITRNEMEPPKLNQGESEAAYRKRLNQFIRDNFKIPRK